MYINEEEYLIIIRHEKVEWNWTTSSDVYFEGSIPVEHKYRVNRGGLFEEVQD